MSHLDPGKVDFPPNEGAHLPAEIAQEITDRPVALHMFHGQPPTKGSGVVERPAIAELRSAPLHRAAE